MQNFKCPRCNHSISIRELFNFNQKHKIICPHCKTTLRPKYLKSFKWGFAIGFLAFVIHAKIHLNYYNNFFVVAIIGFLCSAVAIFTVSFYTYKTTEFEES